MGRGRRGRPIRRLTVAILGVAVTGASGAAAGQELPLPEDPPGMQKIAGVRARDVALHADPDSLLTLYPEIRAFIDPGEHPFGRLHPEAPPETEQYGRLAGVWYTENKALHQGTWYCCWHAVWAWKYVIDGFAVQDYWFQLEKDLPPVTPLGRNSSLTQLRVFQPDSGTWSVSFVNNRAGAGGPVRGSFLSREEEGTMVMWPPKPDDPGAPLRRIVFYDISRDHWRWRFERSEDGGRSWQVRTRIEAYRIPVSPRPPPR